MVSSNAFSANDQSASLGENGLVKSLLDSASLTDNSAIAGLHQTLNVKPTGTTALSTQLDQLTATSSSSTGSGSQALLNSSKIPNQSFGFSVSPTILPIETIPIVSNKSAAVSNQGTIIDPITGSLTQGQSANITPTEALPDLIAQFGPITSPKGTQKSSSTQLTITNQGNTLAKGAIAIDLYASTDVALDAKDQLLTTVKPTVNLAPGQSQTLTIDFKVPKEFAAQPYYLLADIDSKNAIREISKANNLAIVNGSSSVTVPTVVPTATPTALAVPLAAAAPTAARTLSNAKTDVLWRNSLTGEVKLWDMSGTNFVAELPISFSNDTNWKIQGTGDFDGDGQSDVLWRNYATGENATWLMNGNAIKSVAFLSPVTDLDWTIRGVGDFNGDGKVDIVWRKPTDGSNAIWLMNGTTLLSGIYTTSVSDPNWQIQGTGDFNNDGQADLVWQGPNRQTAVWLMNGTTLGVGLIIASPTEPNWQIQGTGDFNNDGKTDLLWRNTTDGRDAVWLMNGTTFGSGILIQPQTDLNWQAVGTFKLYDQSPVVTAKLLNDTAAPSGTNTDRISKDPTITGKVTGVTTLKAGLAKTPGNPTTFIDVTSKIQPDGTFLLNPATLQQINGGVSLVDGTYALTLQAIDSSNVSGTVSVAFTLDATPPTINLTTSLTAAPLSSTSKLTGSVVDSTGSGIASLKYRFDNLTEVVVTPKPDGTFDQSLNLTGVSAGLHTVTLVAMDVAGNVTTNAYNVTVLDTQAPTISTSFDSSNLSQPKIVAQVTDDNGVSSVQARFSTQPSFTTISIDATGKYTIDLKTLNSNLALSLATPYTVYLQATDTSNNTSALQAVQVYLVDPTQPINLALSNPNGTPSSVGKLQLSAPNGSDGPKNPDGSAYTGPIFVQQTPEGEVKIDIGNAVCRGFKFTPSVPPPRTNPSSPPFGRFDYKLYYLGGSGGSVAVGGGNFDSSNQLVIKELPQAVGGGGGLTSGDYLLAPDYVPVKALSEIDANPDENCVACRSRKQFNADASVELHSGAVLKTEDLVSYQSKDQTHTWTLGYNSLQADARPIVHFGYDDIGTNIKDNYLMTGLLTVKTSGGDVVAKGYTSDLGVPGAKVGENYWKLPSQGGALQGALQVDMSGQASGVYDYTLETGIKVLCDCNTLVGDSTPLYDQLVVINGADSDFGTGWGLTGLQRIYETTTTIHLPNNQTQPEYNALLVDGSGSYIVFKSSDGSTYRATNGDFSVLTKQNGSFSRITQDGTVYAFNSSNRLISTIDRNGQQTQIVYDMATKRLLRIVDAAGLTTTFTYGTEGKIVQITDPAGRVTKLNYYSYKSSTGATQYQLTSIIDPDTYIRTFGYDVTANPALLTSDTDKRAKTSTITYDALTGRAKQATDKDGAVTTVSPAQIQGVRLATETNNPLSKTLLTAAKPELGPDPFGGKLDQLAFATYKDAAQNAGQHTGDSKIYLNRAQEETSTKDEFGTANVVERSYSSLFQERYLPSKVTDARGQITSYTYNYNGNVTQVTDPLASGTPAPGSFFPDANLPSLSSTTGSSSVAVDWDGDKNVDIVSSSGNGVTVAYGDGKGLFSAPVNLTTTSSSFIAVGDLNHDGSNDLVTIENVQGTTKVRIYLSDSTNHTLQTPQEVGGVPQGLVDPNDNSLNPPRFSGVTHLVLADLTGDNNPEIVAMGLGYNNEKWEMTLKNDGSGHFTDPANGALQNPLGLLRDNFYGERPDSSQIVVGDINGDNRQDIVVATYGSGSSTIPNTYKIYTLLGQTTGGLGPAASFSTTIYNPTTIALGHFSSATKNDLLISNYDSGSGSTLQTFVGNGLGGFAAPTTQTVTGNFFKDSLQDVNGDGVIDLVTTNTDATLGKKQFLVRYGAVPIPTGSTGTFGAAQTYSTNSTAQADPIGWGDLDGNGQLDLLLKTANTISSLQQQPDHSFVVQPSAGAPGVSATKLAFSSTPIQTIVGDVSGDLVPDLIALTSTGLSMRMGYGDSTYADPITVALSGANQTIAAGDLNGDGSQDIVVADSTGKLTVVLSDGRGKFVTPQALAATISVGGNPTALALQDLNGDGKLDLVSANTASGTVSVLFGTGTGSFTTGGTYTVGTNPKALAIGDLNGDGKLDIAVANAGSNSVSVLTNNGAGGFSTAATYTLTSSPTAIAIGDVNGDGKRDLVVGATGVQVAGTYNVANNVWVFSGQAGAVPSTTVPPKIYTFGNDPVTALALADMNGDGKLDVVTANTTYYANSPIYVQLGGSATLLDKQRYQFNPYGSFNPGTLALADLDLDGATDILTVENNNAVVRLNDRLRIALPQAQGKRVTEYDTKFDPTTGLFAGTYSYHFNNQVITQVTREVDELGRQTIYQLDDNTGNVVRSIRVMGTIDTATQLTNHTGDDLVTDYAYTADGRVLDMRDPLNHVTHYEYTADALNVGGQLRRVTYAYGTADAATESYEYDAAGNRTASIDEYGNRTTYDYDAMNRVIKMTAPDPDGAGSLTAPVTLYEYDQNGNQIKTTGPDPDGAGPRVAAVTTSTYDAMNRLVSTTAPDPDGAGPQVAAVTTYEYDRNGNQTATVDALGRRTESVYDSRNRLMTTMRKDATGAVLSTSNSVYDAINNATGAIDANNKRTNTVYDQRGRRIREIDALGNVTRFIYDAANQLAAQVDAKGNMTRYVYDDLGRQIKVIDANGSATQTIYDNNGNVTARIDANGNRTESRYDNRDRVVKTYDANNTGIAEASRKFTETKYGRVTVNGIVVQQTQMIDPNVNTTTYIYDGLGRLSTDTNQLGKTRTYKYDAVGNQVEIIDRNGLDRTFDYDTLNRQTSENWLTVVAGTTTVTRSFVSKYDVLDRLIDVTDQSVSGTTTTPLSRYGYTYDDLDRVKTIDNLGVGGVAQVALNYVYDAEGNLTSVTDKINGATTPTGTLSYVYDALNRATQITQTSTTPGFTSKRVNMAYNAVGQMTSLQRLAGTTFSQVAATTTYAYNDPLNRLTQIQHVNTTGANISKFDFTYDKGSRITQIASTAGTAASTSVNYSYANDDELTGANYSSAQPAEAYTYDANGNRTKANNLNYTTGTNNQLSADGKYAYTYDDEGNLKTRKDLTTLAIRTFNWDYRNRLVSVVEGSVTLASYAYDANNQRIAKTTGGTTTRYVYDRNNVTMEFNGAAPTPSVRYLYGLGADQILAQDKGGSNVSWQLTDQLGSVRALVDNNGTVRNRYEYDAFGNVVSTMAGATDDSRYRYTGREWDAETGLYYYRARYYDSNSGRFIGQDPAGFEAGDGTNLYAYVKNDPIDRVDPLGLYGILLQYDKTKSPTRYIKYFNKGVKHTTDIQDVINARKTNPKVSITTDVTVAYIGYSYHDTGSKASVNPKRIPGFKVGDNRGHIVGKQLGGSGKDINNLFAQNESMNQVGWQAYESEVRSTLDNYK